MGTLEIIAVPVSFLAIWLTARRSMWCWPINLLACALYFKVFLDVRLYSDMALQALFGMMILYGWIAWARGKGEDGEVVVRPLPRLNAIIALSMGAIGALSVGWMTSRYTDAAVPWLDATLSSFSLVAQFWTARRHAASWVLWIILDTVYVGMFAYKGLGLTAVLYTAMTGLAVLGYRRWKAGTR